MKAVPLFVIVSQVSVLLPIVAGIVYYKKLPPAFRILFYFLLLCIGFEFLAAITRKLYNNNMPGLHIYTVVQLLAYSAIYYLEFRENSVMRLVIRINAIMAIVVALVDAYYVSGIFAHNTLSRSYSSVSVVIYTLIYFLQLFQKDTTRYSWEFPMFWVSLGTLIYFASNTLYFMLKQYLLIKAAGVETFSYCVFLSSNIVTHCLYAQSFRCFRKWKKES